MAMNQTPQPADLLDRKAAVAAGVASILLCLAVVAMVGLFLYSFEAPSTMLIAGGVMKAVFLLVLVGVSVQLIRGQSWAQRVLLVVWLAGLLGVALAAISMLLWEQLPWWPAEWWPEGWPFWPAMGIGGAAELVMVLLLVKAAAPGSRQRYGTYATLSIAAAVALAVLVNLYSQDTYLRRDVETLGRYSLSPRARQIVQGIGEPTRLTCIYTAMDETGQVDRQRQRVMELLQEMAELNSQVSVANVTTDMDKARLVARLAERHGAQAAEHRRVLEQFALAAPTLAKDLRAEQTRWSELTGKSYLDQWGFTAQIAGGMGQLADRVDKAATKIQSSLAGGLPDYAALTAEARVAVKETDDFIGDVDDYLRKIAGIPDAVRSNRADVLEAIAAAEDAVGRMIDSLGSNTTTAPADPEAILAAFDEAASAAARQLGQTARSIDAVAGPDRSELLGASQAWLAPGQTGTEAVLPDGTVVVLGRQSVTDLYAAAARTAAELKTAADTYRQAARAEFQAKAIGQIRESVAALQGKLTAARQAASGALDTLVNVDSPTAALLAQAVDGHDFADVRQPVADLLAELVGLPEIAEDTLSRDITGENIVLIEIGDQAEVAGYEAVWPLKIPAAGPTDEPADAQRVFNGDQAISSRLLAMTQKPFATVVLTHWMPDLGPQLNAAVAPAEIAPDNLTTLRRRLEEANFRVAEWNLTEDRPAAEEIAGEPLPQVLVVLAPPMMPVMPQGQVQLPSFGPEQVDKVRDAIDAGTPAIFLAQYYLPRQMSMFMPPVQPPYHWNSYLMEDWGIDVLSDLLVVPGIPDDQQPDRYRIDPLRFTYMPLNQFTDHPIGRPLQGQRTLWRQIAPVATSSRPDGVTLTPLLTVPAEWNDVWATSDLEALARQIRGEKGSFIRPDYEGGDLPAGFAVAMAAERAAGQDVAAARVVVLGMGASLVDGYLDAQVSQLTDKGLLLNDPPAADAEVVINSLYWMTGRESYIAAGPARVKPVAQIDPTTRWTLWTLCVLALPAAVLLTGCIVLLSRRR